MIGAPRAHTFASSPNHWKEDAMDNTSDRHWMIPFFVVIGAGIGFFFLQMAQFGLLIR
jgi:hypothetical protein